MEQTRFVDHDFLNRIDQFIAERGLTPTTFGVKAINDPDLVRELRDGRELRRKTRERIEQFMCGAGTSEAAE